MYAIVQAGGHQYRVQEGDQILLDYTPGDVGSKVKMEKVLMLGGTKNTVGAPFINGASVEATIAEQGRHEKVLVFKYRRRKNYKKMHGHRQAFTKVTINKIQA